MDSRYRQYSGNVPNYLKNRPREFVKHCLIKLSMAKAIRNNSITIINHGVFSVKSENSNNTYTVCFGDDENMPSCSCPAWSELYYPCKHFFSIFEKFSLWSWEHLSSLYTNSPFLNLDNEKEEKFVNDVNNEASEKYEETAANDDAQ